MGSVYRNAVWVWDDLNNGLTYQSKDFRQPPSQVSSRVSTLTQASAGRVMDTVDTYTQAKFKKHYQRRVKLTDIAVATIQDIKDVAIFTCKIDYLYPEFITYFHTESIDRFLRSVIIYFQYYLQVWNKMQFKRKEASRKLRQPIVTILENEDRDNLADLRSMVARDYATILMGIGDAKTFHHMNNKNNDSLSDRDRRIYETLLYMTVKVVWIALFRKNLQLIGWKSAWKCLDNDYFLGKELNRMVRTLNYSPEEHIDQVVMNTTAEENRVLLGRAYRPERKLLHRSPAIQEIVFDDHDYRMLSIGINDIPNTDERIRYLEIAYAAPEELLVEAGIAVGVLGVERKYLDAMLKPLEMSTTVKRTSLMKTVEFKIPPKTKQSKISINLSPQPSQFHESPATKSNRIIQCRKWRTYLDMGGVIVSNSHDMDSIHSVTHSSYSTDLSNYDE